MELREGQFYILHSGAIAGPATPTNSGFRMRTRGSLVDPMGCVRGPDNWHFDSDGTYSWPNTHDCESNANVARRFLPRLEVGRVFRLRNGDKVSLRREPIPIWGLTAQLQENGLMVRSGHGEMASYATIDCMTGLARGYPPGTDGSAFRGEQWSDLIAEILDDGTEVPMPLTWAEYDEIMGVYDEIMGVYDEIMGVDVVYARPDMPNDAPIIGPLLSEAMERRNLASPTEGKYFSTVYKSPIIRKFVEEADVWFADGCKGPAPSDIRLGIEVETQDGPTENDDGEEDEGYAAVSGWEVGRDNTVQGCEYRFAGKLPWSRSVQAVRRLFELDLTIDRKCSFHIHTSLEGVKHSYGARFQRRLIGALLSRVKDIPTRVLQRWQNRNWTREYFEFKVEEDKYTAVSQNNRYKTWEFRAFGNVYVASDGIRCMELAVWCLAAAYSTLIIPEWEGDESDEDIFLLFDREVARRQAARDYRDRIAA